MTKDLIELDSFMTYDDFEKYMTGLKNYTYEYTNDSLHIFYDYDKKEKIANNTITMREPLFTINLSRAFSIVTPYGYRFTQAKQMKGFDELESKAITLSRTPIYMRGAKEGGGISGTTSRNNT